MAKAKDVKRTPSGKIDYRGETFSGFNKSKTDSTTKHKRVVLAKKGDEVKLIRFGHDDYGHNYSPEARKNYLARSAGIKNKAGGLTKDDKFSANYWARKELWAPGGSKKKKT
jgi:hypothetical protein